jgi:site-specific DNA-methyltransferase (adenine-specific)
MPNIEIVNADCMEIMKSLPDNHFDLAIVDPPYGSKNIFGGYAKGNGGGVAKNKQYHKAIWTQQKPNREYFQELFRVSKNQIIWGANHFISRFALDSPGWIYWDKDNGQASFSDGELAWTSFYCGLRSFKYTWAGFRQGNMKVKQIRIHPTEKPVQLYRWILDNFANPGDKIFDSHSGSASLAIACHDMGFDLLATEIDEIHHRDSLKRFREHIKQQKIEFR